MPLRSRAVESEGEVSREGNQRQTANAKAWRWSAFQAHKSVAYHDSFPHHDNIILFFCQINKPLDVKKKQEEGIARSCGWSQ